MAENRSKSDGFMLRFPPGLRERVKADADDQSRSMNAEIIWRIEHYAQAHEAWARADAELSGMKGEILEGQLEIERLHEGRSELYEVINKQELTLQSLQNAHRTMAIMVRSIGDALLTDSKISDFVRVLATGLAQVEIDQSSDPSEELPKHPWEY